MQVSTTRDSLYPLAETLRSEMAFSDAGVLAASLIILRCIDAGVSTGLFTSTPDGVSRASVLPVELRWQNLLRARRSYYEGSDWLTRLATSIRDLERVGPNFVPLADTFARSNGFSFRSVNAMLEWLDEQPFDTSRDRRALLEGLDELLTLVFETQKGEFRTPPAIAKLMAGLADPQPGDHIYDPCFGTAGLLTAAIDTLNREQGSALTPRSTTLAISGFERSRDAFIVGLARLMLAGGENLTLTYGNSLDDDFRAAERQCDLVVANPPWNSRLSSDESYRYSHHYPVRTKDAAVIFIQHSLFRLREGGRAAFVIPQGLLFKGGSEREFRQWLLEQHTVEAVVSLPAGAFSPYASIQTSILLLRRGGPTHQIRMVDAETFFERSRENRGLILSDSAIADLVHSTRSPVNDRTSWSEDVETIAQTEWDLSARRRHQSGLDQTLNELENKVPVSPLGKLCQIWGGASFKSQELVDVASETPSLVRIKDIRKGAVGKGSSWLTLEAVAHLDPKMFLCNEDILCSKSGTIGKIGLVQSGAVGSVPANGLYVLRSQTDLVHPSYLIAFLNSADCRSRLSDQARGSVIQHLPIDVLRALPVPVPPLDMQMRIAEQFRERETDALGMLALLLGAAEQDPVSRWIETALGRLPVVSEPLSDPFNFGQIETLVRELQPIRNNIAHVREVSSLGSWVLPFFEAINRLKGAQSIPKGPSLLNVLQDALDLLQGARKAVSGPLPIEARANSLTDVVAYLVRAAMTALTEDIRLTVSSSISALSVGQQADVELIVKNEGAMPVRDFQLSTEPNWGGETRAYLAEGQTTSVWLSGMAPKEVGPFELNVRWTASTLEGRPIREQRQVAFAIVAQEDQVEADQDLGASPYVCGDPVRPERNDVFFGREDLIEKIKRTVTHSGNVVLLEGNRRAGKSSILWHLEGRNRVPGWLGVYCSLQAAEGSKDQVGVPTVEVFRVIASEIAKAVQALGGETLLPNGMVLPPQTRLGIPKACREGITEQSPFSDLREYVEAILSVLQSQGLGLLLMLDEFDKLQEGIDSGVTSPQVPENIRYLIQTNPSFSAILTGSRRLKRLREEYWSALFGLGTREGVTALEDDAARRLVTKPVKERLTYTREAVDYVTHVSACQPYILQCLCNRIFGVAAEMNARSVSLEIAETAARELIRGWEHFASLWDYAQTDRRRFILAVCHREAKTGEPITFPVLQELLAQRGIEVTDESLIDDIEFLKELELLDLVGAAGSGQYSLAIPLMGDWIDFQQDFDVLQRKARSESEDYEN